MQASTAGNLHLAGTADCVDCCKTPHTMPWYSAFETQAPNGTWLPAAAATVHRNSVVVSSLVPISGVRSGFGGMPDCLLYNGEGGADNHSGLVAPPFRRCLYGEGAGLPGWSWNSDCNRFPTTEVGPVAAGAARLPSAEVSDFLIGATKVVVGVPDAGTSGRAFSSGVRNGGASLLNRWEIGCGAAGSASEVVDSVELSFRYRAPLNASTNNTAAVLKVSLVNADTKPVAVVVAALPLGNYTSPAGFSAPVVVKVAGLKASCAAGIGANPRGRLLLQLAITNNDRPVTIPIDDLAGGFNIRVGWAAAALS